MSEDLGGGGVGGIGVLGGGGVCVEEGWVS